MAALNYAEYYGSALAQAYPFTLNFGALYDTENNRTYLPTKDKIVKIPSITTTGSVNSDRDNITLATRNYNNAWETKELKFPRAWGTSIHPADLAETHILSIEKITKTYNEEQKFPEMDAYTVSKLYSDWKTTVTAENYTGHTPDTTALSATNVLQVFDDLMLKMDEAMVPANGRILYVTYEVKKMLKNADKVDRSWDVQSAADAINRTVNRLDEVTVVGVPSVLMKTKYNFTVGWKVATDAEQINMFLVHPSAVLTPVLYTFSQLDEPSAGSQGKYVYYEERFQDAFILNNKADGLQFNITAAETD